MCVYVLCLLGIISTDAKTIFYNTTWNCTISGCVIEYCFSIWVTNLMNVFKCFHWCCRSCIASINVCLKPGTHWQQSWLSPLISTLRFWRQIGNNLNIVSLSQSTFLVDFIESGWFLSPKCRTSFQLCHQGFKWFSTYQLKLVWWVSAVFGHDTCDSSMILFVVSRFCLSVGPSAK